MVRHERDYIARTIETVRNHRDADNCWPQWANILADHIEDLEALADDLGDALRECRAALAVPTLPKPHQEIAYAAMFSADEALARLDARLRWLTR